MPSIYIKDYDTTVDFPEDTPNDVMQKALQSKFPDKKKLMMGGTNTFNPAGIVGKLPVIGPMGALISPKTQQPIFGGEDLTPEEQTQRQQLLKEKGVPTEGVVEPGSEKTALSGPLGQERVKKVAPLQNIVGSMADPVNWIPTMGARKAATQVAKTGVEEGVEHVIQPLSNKLPDITKNVLNKLTPPWMLRQGVKKVEKEVAGGIKDTAKVAAEEAAKTSTGLIDRFGKPVVKDLSEAGQTALKQKSELETFGKFLDKFIEHKKVLGTDTDKLDITGLRKSLRTGEGIAPEFLSKESQKALSRIVGSSWFGALAAKHPAIATTILGLVAKGFKEATGISIPLADKIPAIGKYL